MRSSTRPQRLNQADVQKPLFLLVAVALVVGGVICLLSKDVMAVRIFAAGLLATGLLLGWLGARHRDAFFTDEGLLRTGWTGRELIAWSKVETIELDEIPGQLEDVGILRLRTQRGRRVTVRLAPAEVDPIAARVSETCPQAFVDDARTGEVTAPREGRRDAARRREQALRRRAAARHTRIAALWALAGLVGTAGVVVVPATGALRRGVGPWMILGMMLVMAAGSFWNVAIQLYVRREFIEA